MGFAGRQRCGGKGTTIVVLHRDHRFLAMEDHERGLSVAEPSVFDDQTLMFKPGRLEFRTIAASLEAYDWILSLAPSSGLNRAGSIGFVEFRSRVSRLPTKLSARSRQTGQ